MLTNKSGTQEARLWALLLMSYALYAMMDGWYLLLLMAATGVTYAMGRCIEKAATERAKLRTMWAGIGCVLLPLLSFKCMNWSGWLLPVGLSYYTFMAISYLVDVYNEEVEAEKNVVRMALFLGFFPYVFSGPIERAGNMLPQMKNLPSPQPSDWSQGAKTMLWGYFMKSCVADRLGVYIGTVAEEPGRFGGSTLALQALLEPLQAYADLGGYSLMAIGVAQCLGFRISANFRQPLYATSLSEMWRRWHMTFVNWLLDYLYTPIAFALRKWRAWGIGVALLVTLVLSGMWHGTTLPYLIWGVLQAMCLGLEALCQGRRNSFEKKHNLLNKKGYQWICRVNTYLLFALLYMIGTRTDMGELQLYVSRIFGQEAMGKVFFDLNTAIHATLSVAMLLYHDHCREHGKKMAGLESEKLWIRLTCTALLICYILACGVLNNNSFIYYRY